MSNQTLPISSQALTSYLLGETDTLKTKNNYPLILFGILLGILGIKLMRNNRKKSNKYNYGLCLLIIG